jgi:hypothetical protein
LSEKKSAKMSIYLPDEVRTRFKMACAYHQASMNGVLLDLIEGWLTENDPMMQKEPPTPNSSGKGRGKKGVKDD